MTASDRPGRPADLEDDALEALAKLEVRDNQTLRAVASYLEDLAAWKEQRADHEQGDDLEFPEGVPEHASVSVEEVAGTEIRYYQWWDGEELESVTERR